MAKARREKDPKRVPNLNIGDPMSHVKKLRPLDNDEITSRPDSDETRIGKTDVEVKRSYENDKNFEAAAFRRHPQYGELTGLGFAGPSYEDEDQPIESANKARQIAYNRASDDSVKKAHSGEAAKAGTAENERRFGGQPKSVVKIRSNN